MLEVRFVDCIFTGAGMVVDAAAFVLDLLGVVTVFVLVVVVVVVVDVDVDVDVDVVTRVLAIP